MYARGNGQPGMASREQTLGDEELMRRVAAGSEEALGLLYRRFGRPIFCLAIQALDRAAELGLPLGTAKTRIRAGLERLRSMLTPQRAALAVLTLLAAVAVRYRSEHATLARYDRALSMVTASDSVNLRMEALPGNPEETHARYRSRPGV